MASAGIIILCCVKPSKLRCNMRRSKILQHSSPKRIAYTCKEGDLCGGLGDRLKGFASTFLLALLLNAEFVVEWTYPVRLHFLLF